MANTILNIKKNMADPGHVTLFKHRKALQEQQ